jgi:hypothetical protein
VQAADPKELDLLLLSATGKGKTPGKEAPASGAAVEAAEANGNALDVQKPVAKKGAEKTTAGPSKTKPAAKPKQSRAAVKCDNCRRKKIGNCGTINCHHACERKPTMQAPN